MNFRRRNNRFQRSRGRRNYSFPKDENNLLSSPVKKRNVSFVSSEKNIVVQQLPSCPYQGWSLYFPTEEYERSSVTARHIIAFKEYFQSLQLNLEFIETQSYAIINFSKLNISSMITKCFGNFRELFESNPKQLITEMSLAVHSMVYDIKSEKLNEIFKSYVHVRMVNHTPILHKCGLKANQLGHFVSIRGAVVRVSQVKPICTRMCYSCLQCKNEQIVVLPDGYKFAVPTKCINKMCKSKNFQSLKDTNDTITIDYQIIRVQETGSDCPLSFGSNSNNLMNEDRSEGRIPRSINCILIRDLVDGCVPGDEIVVTGIVVTESVNSGNHNSNENCLFNLILQVNSYRCLRGSDENEATIESQINLDNSEFSPKDLYAIDAIHSELDLFRLLVTSLCPSIYGHELIKASLLLALFGGVTKFGNDKNKVEIRGNSHVLIVGDPGLGKSQMLQAACAVAPRSVYICGSTASTAGLTVTFTKESVSENCLEAGALVISDQGCCCIDEFDKMSVQQHSSLLEAMEQQSISVAKAGMVCNLSARTSILAAANPSTGHYDKSKTVSENLKMSAPLLSRFDLVFIMLDRPNEVMDSKLSRYVLSLHTGKSLTKSSLSQSGQMDTKSLESIIKDPESSIQQRLTYGYKEVCDPIPTQLLRKYIAYSRKYVHPKLNQDASNLLQEFYLNLRKRRHTMDGTPITTRQLESMVRLTEARARAELREVATFQDATDVKELMLESMMGVYSDELGILNFSRSQGGSGMSKNSSVKKLISLLQVKSERSGSSLFTTNDIKELALVGNIRGIEIEQMINTLNIQGFLLKKGSNLFKFLTAGF